MSLITTTEALGAFCTELRGEPFVTVDTEFMRDRTYYAKLCLVQLGGSARAAAVDPLADGISLEPLLELFADPTVLKVFHAARQDVEIFVHMTGRAPQPLFDTQIAAMVCGYGEEVAYDTLVAQIAKARLDKSSRFTDWSRRPLSEAQLRYALGDVIHLRTICEVLAAELEREGRTSWVEEEFRVLTDPALHRVEPEDAWKRLKVRSRDPRFLAIVQELAAWREREAQRRDLPRNRVLRDDHVLEVAASKPKTAQDVGALPRVSLDNRSAQAVVEAIGRALERPLAECPHLPEPKRMPRGIGPIVELLRVLLRLKAEEHGVAQRLLATTGDLEEIAQDDAAEVPALRGWRCAVFGAAALDLKHGRLGLAVKGGHVRLLEMSAGARPD